ncbi:MAG: PaaI family thioesterase [Acidobacteriota bacterium]|nr:PaaI family thioesterase [Acidobacteriota bacterium]
MINEQNKQKAFEVVKSTPYLKLLGIELVELEPEKAVMKLEMQEKLRQPHGLLHGGATASIIDTAMAFAVTTCLTDEEKASTVDLTVQYLRPHTEGKITCTAKILRAGKRLLFVSAEVVNDKDKLIATALSTYTKV